MQDTLTRLRAICDAATDGPWEVSPYEMPEDTYCEVYSPFTADGSGMVFDSGVVPDAEFVALSRTALPALLEVVQSEWRRFTDGQRREFSRALENLEVGNEDSHGVG